MRIDVWQVLRRYDGDPLIDVTNKKDADGEPIEVRNAEGQLIGYETERNDLTLGRALLIALDTRADEGKIDVKDKLLRHELQMRIHNAGGRHIDMTAEEIVELKKVCGLHFALPSQFGPMIEALEGKPQLEALGDSTEEEVA